MDNKGDLEKEMLALAEMVYEISKKHGGIYINVCCTKGASLSWTTYGDNLDGVTYNPTHKKSRKSGQENSQFKYIKDRRDSQ